MKRGLGVIVFIILIATNCFAGWDDILKQKSASGVALPAGTESLQTSKSTLMGENFNTGIYSTNLSFSQIKAFYRETLAKQGWTESKVPADAEKKLGTEIIAFRKGQEMLNIMYMPTSTITGKTTFSIGKGVVPSTANITEAKLTPQKLNFMPLYPGLQQMSYSERPNATTVGYTTKDDITSVVTFYKSRMPGYGWMLSKDRPVTRETIPESAMPVLRDCPTCPKDMDIRAGIEAMVNLSAEMQFVNDKGDICYMTLYQTKAEQPKAGAQLSDAQMGALNQTVLVVSYSRSISYGKEE